MAEEKNKKKITLAVVCLVGAGIILAYNFSDDPGAKGGHDPNDKIWMKCRDPQCKAEFEITADEYRSFLADYRNSMAVMDSDTARMPGCRCPECEQLSAYQAIKCPNCGLVFETDILGSQAYPDKCPKCGYSELAEQTRE